MTKYETNRRGDAEMKRLLAATIMTLATNLPVCAADGTVKVGLVLPMTGPFASTGRQIASGVRLYVAQHGTTAGGRHVEVIVKDDGAVPDATRRLAQELIVNDHAAVIAGMGLTPLALAVTSLATQAKVPEVVMAAATSSITAASPFVVRTSMAIPQNAYTIAGWAAANGIKRVATAASDYGPGIDAEKWFGDTFAKAGGTVAASLRIPLANPDFSPFLQRVADVHPDALFIFLPSGQGAQFMHQFAERGLDKQGIRIVSTGDVPDDDVLNDMGDIALGMVTSYYYSAMHGSPENKSFVAAYRAANENRRPNMFAVSGYDGMHLIYAALDKTKGDTSGIALIEAMKGLAWTSPRGPISIDPMTRDITQNIYIREVKRVDGELYNVEFQTVPNLRDPAKP